MTTREGWVVFRRRSRDCQRGCPCFVYRERAWSCTSPTRAFATWRRADAAARVGFDTLLEPGGLRRGLSAFRPQPNALAHRAHHRRRRLDRRNARVAERLRGRRRPGVGTTRDL